MLNEKILGDIQSYNFEKQNYDLIVCWHVLEHLENPKAAFNNFIKAIKDDGLIIIASPNPFSIKGLITKFSPHWFHVFVYRYFYGRKDAGKNDTALFRTQLKFFINPKSLIKFANDYGFTCIANIYFDALDGWVGDSIKKKSSIIFSILKYLKKFSSLFAFNLISESDFILVIKR